MDNSGISAQPTDRNGRSWTACPLLRIRRLGVRVPPSAPSSTAISPLGSSVLANGFANSRTLTGRDRAREDVRRRGDLIADHVRVDPQRHRWVSMSQAGRHHMHRHPGQQQGCGVDMPQIMQPRVRKQLPGTVLTYGQGAAASGAAGRRQRSASALGGPAERASALRHSTPQISQALSLHRRCCPKPSSSPHDCPARGRRVKGSPSGRRMRSAMPTLDPAPTHKGTGSYEEDGSRAGSGKKGEQQREPGTGGTERSHVLSALMMV